MSKPLESTPAASQSYARILQSSAVMGASFAVVIVLSFIRMKVMAVFVGPSGVGLLGVLSTVLDLCVALVGLGIQQSGVRQIAAARSEEARRDISQAIQWLSLGLGIFGAAVLFFAAVPVSLITFGDQHQASGVAIIAVAVLLKIVSGSKSAILQGLRQIGSLARVNVLAALLSTAICVPLVYFWREQAVAPAVVAMACSTAAITWLFARKHLPGGRPSHHGVVGESGHLVSLGLIFMASTLMTTGAAYLARVAILHHSGIEGAGLYQAAWAVGVLYSGFILQAMGSDFFPRLSGLAHDDAACNRLVNEQMRVSLLLAAPGVLATITLAHWVMHLFYAAEFEAAANTLRWISFGTFLQTLAWPAGFILLAKGAKRPFFWLEASTATLQIALTFALVPVFGHEGAGMAFCLMYLSHTFGVSWLANRASGFAWDAANVGIACGFLILIASVFAAFHLLDEETALWLGLMATALASCLSAAALMQLVPAEAIPSILRPLRARLARAR